MRLLLGALLGSLLLINGCFETAFKLGSPDDAKVDQALCGDWEVNDADAPPEQPKIKMYIRNLDGKHYFVEWTNPNEKDEKDKTLHMVAWTCEVKGVQFAHVRNLPADGTLTDKHLILRFERKDNQLTLRQLDEKFFKDKPLQTDADLRRLVEDNLDNSEMYDDGQTVATKIPGK